MAPGSADRPQRLGMGGKGSGDSGGKADIAAVGPGPGTDQPLWVLPAIEVAPRQPILSEQQQQQQQEHTRTTALGEAGAVSAPTNEGHVRGGSHSGGGERPDAGPPAQEKTNVSNRGLPVWPESAPLPTAVTTDRSNVCCGDEGRGGGGQGVGNASCLDAETLKALSRLFLSKLQVSVEVGWFGCALLVLLCALRWVLRVWGNMFQTDGCGGGFSAEGPLPGIVFLL